MNQDNSQSWVRISYGTNKYVIDSNHNNTEIPADPQEDQVPQTSIKVVAARSKAKAKPQPRELVGTTATIPMHERRWIDIEPSEQNLASYDLSKKVISFLRHNQTLQREQDGAIKFYRIKFHLRNQFSEIQVWSDDRWKACLAAGGGSKRRYQYCSDNSERILYLQALQGHSGNNLIDPMLQDNVVIGTGREPVDVPSIIPMNERKWIDIEPGESSFSAYEISKKVINLLRHSQTVQREEDGAVQFWRIKNYLQNQFLQTTYWSDDRWKVCLAAGGGEKRRYQYCTDFSGTIVYFRALHGHSGRNLVDPSLQDNVII